MLNFRPFETSDVMNIELDYELSGQSRMGLVSHDNIVVTGQCFLEHTPITANARLAELFLGQHHGS